MTATQDDVFKASEGDCYYTRNRTALAVWNPSDDLLLRLLDTYNLQPKSAIEIGAADGFRLAEIQRRFGARVLAIEPSAEAIEEGRRRHPEVEFRQGVAADLPVQELFDLAIVNFVLHWVDRSTLMKSVAEIDRCIKDGGCLLLGDFLPEALMRTPYTHAPESGMFTYKQNYASIFLNSGLYHRVALLTDDHETHQLTPSVTEYSRSGRWLLQKRLNSHYMIVDAKKLPAGNPDASIHAFTGENLPEDRSTGQSLEEDFSSRASLTTVTSTPRSDSMTSFPFLIGATVYLRPIVQADVNDKYASWINDPETNRYLETGRFPTTLAALADFVQRCQNRNDVIFLAIMTKDGDRHIGNIKLEPINWVHRNGIVGIMIGERDSRYKGAGTEAMFLLMRHAFEKLNLHRVGLGVASDNEPGIKSFIKVGFKEEGRLREAIWRSQHYVDHVWMGLLANEFSWARTALVGLSMLATLVTDGV